MQFRVVPGDGKASEAFLRLGLEEGNARQRQNISFDSIGEKTWKDRVKLSALASSGGPVRFEVLSGPGMLKENVLSFTGLGTVVVRVSQDGNDMWLPTAATQTVVASKANQTITFSSIGTQTVTNRVKLSATATGKGAVSFEVESGPGVIEGNVMSFTGAGTVVVQAVQAGNDLWLPASATQTVVVQKAEQSIDFSTIGAQLASARVNLSASATSGGIVTFKVESGPGVIKGNVLSFTGAGTVVVQARQGGDTTWNPAMATQRVLVVSDENVYMVVDISAGPSASSYPVRYFPAEPKGGWPDEYKMTKLVLRRIWPGTFTMGSSSTSDNLPHQVTLTKPYYIGVFEVTDPQWQLVIETGHVLSLAMYPKERSTWTSCCEFTSNLRRRTGLAFDLPTEAQWEYACRAGTTTVFSYGDSPNGDYMWYEKNMYEHASYMAAEVGKKLPNPWGLYDMHGNVLEWCRDYWCELLSEPATDPVGPSSGKYRVIRGGNHFNSAFCSSSAWRSYDSPVDDYVHRAGGLGFRVSVTLTEDIQ